MGKTLRQKLGEMGERLAVGRLTEMNYRVVETNWRCKIGELDIVAWHGQCLTFVEVRTRRGSRAGTPEDSLNPAKQAKLRALVEAYLQEHPALYDAQGEAPACRIDLAAVEFDTSGRLLRLQLRQNVVEDN